jgi:alpha-beta hydrolase superfamily lysophospholipase
VNRVNSQLYTEPRSSAEDECGYLDHGGEGIHYTLHLAQGRRVGQVLLAGPFSASYLQSFAPWMRWGRFLARHGFDVMRFDYRGVGESTGDFADFSFADWYSDLRVCAQWLAERARGLPLVLHGLQMGGLLAGRLFVNENVGTALLLWATPADAREILHHCLRLKWAAEYAIRKSGETQQSHIATLEQGNTLEVEGYQWTGRLWRDSKVFTLVLPDGECRRPWHTRALDVAAGPLDMYWRPGRPDRRDIGLLNPRLKWLFEPELKWLQKHLGRGRA